MTYPLVDVVFLALALLALAAMLRAGKFRVQKLQATHPLRRRPFWRPLLAAGAALMVLTAVFDSVMIAVGLFGYRSGTFSGVLVGLAPIEDFAYPLAAAVVLPALWRWLRKEVG
ncbi:lycopene cyclase domain-containing protein [Sinomonas terrae]|uniref:Lycopene cyclase domain-containing protein n=1 Tax=Sinomonas terrae TaxID=2908838 RepID=A0ABS9U6G7_9MICC|nr:lycopene cyclase domain-containing protein [Sinomonas terrae]MCH6472299.1 lycopene cyclase domain-containing protein [Sinomonas terrae]